MKLERLYRLAIEAGISHDPRGRADVERLLADETAKFKDLKDAARKHFDRDRLFNPYSDTRVLFAGETEASPEVRRLMVGIDIDTAEVLLARTLNREEGAGIDLIVGHHPQGPALVQMFDVMRLQADVLALAGVTVSVAEQLMDKRIGEVERRLLLVNANRTMDAARLLHLPLMCIHTAADNCVADFLTKLFEAEKPAKIKDLLKLLRAIPEYDRAAALQAPPKVISGAEDGSCGRILVDMTGGTEGAKDIYEKLAASGVSTLVGMHMSEEHLTNAKKANLNVVIAGHTPSDVLGLNILFDEAEREERLEFVEVSGFHRVRR